MGLQHVMYSLEEGSSQMICAELTGLIESNIEATISTQNSGNADGTDKMCTLKTL